MKTMSSLLLLLGISWLCTVSANEARCRDSAKISGLEVQIRDLAIRVLQLEERDLQQQLEIDDLRSMVQASEQRNKELQSDIGHLKKDLRVSQRRISSLKQIIGDFRHKASSAKQMDNKQPAATTTDKDDKDTQTSQKERRLTPHVGTRPDPTVAFFASLSSHVKHAGPKQILVFDRVITNIGSAYSNTIGVFTAPVPGVYVFSVTIMSFEYQTEHYTLSKNGVAIINMYARANESPDATTGHTGVLHLARGDTVEIHSNDADGSAFGGHYSSFSGFLLHQDQDDALALIG